MAKEFVSGPPSALISGQTVTFWVHGGELDRRMRVVEHQAKFAEREEVAVFLYLDSKGALWPTGMERGKWRLVRDRDRVSLAPTIGAGQPSLHAVDIETFAAAIQASRAAASGQL
jgi:hypothetical protein